MVLKGLLTGIRDRTLREHKNMGRGQKFIDWCDKAMAFSFYALIYFLPISIALSETFTGLALLFYIFKRLSSFFICVSQRGKQEACVNWFISFLSFFKPPASDLNAPIWIFLLFNLISVIFSRYPVLSIEGFLGKALQSTFLYFNFIEAINSKKRLRKFLVAFLVSATLISINGLYQYFVGKDFIHGHLVYDGRISSSFRAHNDFAAYLIVIIPIFLSLSVLSTITGVKRSLASGKEQVFSFFVSWWGKVQIFMVFALSLVCLGLTFSRGAWIALAFTLLILSARKRRYIIANLLVLILFFNFFYPQLKETRQVRLMVDTVLNDAALDQREKELYPKSAPESAAVVEPEHEAKKLNVFQAYVEKFKSIRFFGGSGRTEYWREAIHMIRDYPVFGIGLNTYSVVGKGYKITWGGYPHNCYLQMAVETGILGLLSFLWLLGVIFNKSFRNLGSVKDPFLSLLLLGSLIGLAGFLVHSFFDTNFYSVQLGSFMWLVMGLIVAIQKIDRSDKIEENN